MSVKLICDHCGRSNNDPPGDRQHGWMVEIRGITDTNVGEIHRIDYAQAQVHWDCLAPYVEVKNAKDEEPPF